jgi:hypothetical protein
MSATTNITGRLSISDFKPGIFSDYHSSVTPTPATTATFDPKINGAAVIDGTWGCCADRSGALVPLPRVVAGKTEALSPSTGRGTVLPNTYLLDALLVDGMQDTDSYPASAPEVVTMQTFLHEPSGVAQASYFRIRRHQIWRPGTLTSDAGFLKSLAGLSHPSIPSGNLSPFRGAVDEISFTDPNTIRKGFAFVAHPLRLDGTSPETGAASEFVTGDMGTADRALTDYDTKHALDGSPPDNKEWPERLRQSVLGYFPNFDTPTSLRPVVTGFLDHALVAEAFRGGFMCLAHQGRLVVAQWLPSRYAGDGGNHWAWKDRLSATGLLDITTPDVSGEFVEENTAGIGTFASLSADELLVVKHTGGGYVLRGSFASPTVTKLPFLESTYGVVSSPAMSPIGLVYGTRNGIFVWEGGETSRHLSPQIDGFFWNHAPGISYEGHRARLGFWHPWVMVPNGYMFDTRHQSWWRLDDPSTHEAYNVFQVSETNKLYAFPWQVTPTRSLLWNTADPDVLASSWSWKSQPLVETREQAFKVRDVSILATATDPGSTITVTITGFDQNGVSQTITVPQFVLGSAVNTPQMVMRDVTNTDIPLTHMQVLITATNTNGNAAPKLHSISFGTLDSGPVVKS